MVDGLILNIVIVAISWLNDEVNILVKRIGLDLDIDIATISRILIAYKRLCRNKFVFAVPLTSIRIWNCLVPRIRTIDIRLLIFNLVYNLALGSRTIGCTCWANKISQNSIPILGGLHTISKFLLCQALRCLLGICQILITACTKGVLVILETISSQV